MSDTLHEDLSAFLLLKYFVVRQQYKTHCCNTVATVSLFVLLAITCIDCKLGLYPSVLSVVNPFQSNFSATRIPPALIYFGRERGWWITCNYPTVLKEININRKSTTCAICWFSCSRCFSSCSTDFIQQIVQVVLFLFLFISFKTVG
jgi:hypothetical protein